MPTQCPVRRSFPFPVSLPLGLPPIAGRGGGVSRPRSSEALLEFRPDRSGSFFLYFYFLADPPRFSAPRWIPSSRASRRCSRIGSRRPIVSDALVLATLRRGNLWAFECFKLEIGEYSSVSLSFFGGVLFLTFRTFGSLIIWITLDLPFIISTFEPFVAKLSKFESLGFWISELSEN